MIYFPFAFEKTGTNKMFNFKSCCEKALEKMNESGVRIINNSQVMTW